MNGAGFMRMKKLRGSGIILMAARHNRREIAAELGARGTIDPARSSLNVRLIGPCPAQAVADRAQELMRAAGIDKLRKNAVPALEFLFSLPVDLSIDRVAYFRDCVAWVATQFGGEANILSADVHLDEAQPHCHVLLLPMRDGTLQGSDMFGGPRELESHQKSFHEAVAARHGLRRARPKLSGVAHQELAQAVLHCLRDAQDPAQHSAVWSVIRDAVERDPMSFAAALGIEPAAAVASRTRTFSDIMTSRGKGAKTHADAARRDSALMARHSGENTNPIGFQSDCEEQTLSCVGFGQTATAHIALDPDVSSVTCHGVARRTAAPQAQVQARQVQDSQASARTSPPVPSPTYQETAIGIPQVTVDHPQALATTSGLRTRHSASLLASQDEQVPAEYSRDRESEQLSTDYCGQTGEYHPQPVVEHHGRRAADLEVAKMLIMRGLKGSGFT